MGLFDKFKNFVDRRGQETYEEEDDEEIYQAEEDEGDYPAPSDLDQPPAYTFMDAMRASAQGNLQRVSEYLRFNAGYVRCRDWDNNTLLHRAALFARAEVVKLLLDNGAEVNLRYKEKTPLHYAVATDAAWVKANKREETWENHKQQQYATARLLLEHGAALDAADDKGETPLHTAARLGLAELSGLLLEHGAAVDLVAGTVARTPLLVVARHTKNPKIIKFLLDKGANPDGQDQDPGYTALHYLAVAPHYPEAEKEKLLAGIAQLLLKHGANPNSRTPKQNTPLHMAAANNHLALAEVLLDNRADINAIGDRDMSPMGIAASNGSVEMVELLLKRGVDLYASRALYHAAYCKRSDAVLKLLVERGAEINRPDSQGITPIFAAISANSMKNVKFLLDHGADTKIHPPGRTVLQHAFANWGAIEAMPEKERAKYADDARDIIQILGGFDGLKLDLKK
jgi:ankyrin repeat protein